MFTMSLRMCRMRVLKVRRAAGPGHRRSGCSVQFFMGQRQFHELCAGCQEQLYRTPDFRVSGTPEGEIARRNIKINTAVIAPPW